MHVTVNYSNKLEGIVACDCAYVIAKLQSELDTDTLSDKVSH